MNSPAMIPSESIGDLVDRLGPPPDEVVRDWIEQAKSMHRDLPADLNDPAWFEIRVDEGGLLVLPAILTERSSPDEAPPRTTNKKWSVEKITLWATVALLVFGVGWWAFQKPKSVAQSQSKTTIDENPFDTRVPPRTSKSNPSSSRQSQSESMTRSSKSSASRPSATAFSLDAFLPPSDCPD